MKNVKIYSVPIKNPKNFEIIIGQGNFTIKTIEDLHEVLLGAKEGIEFGVAMNEAKPKLVRFKGNNRELEMLAADTAKQLGAGHLFVIFLKNAFPIHVLKKLKEMECIANIFVATSNPLEIIVAETDLGKAVLGAVDGTAANAIETEQQRKERLELLKKLGY